MKILLVEDSVVIRNRLKNAITETGGDVIGEADNQEDAIREIDKREPELLVLDLSLAYGNGLNVLRHVREKHPWIRVFVLTNYSSSRYCGKCLELGADHFFDKTKDFPLFIYAINSLICSGNNEAVFGGAL